MVGSSSLARRRTRSGAAQGVRLRTLAAFLLVVAVLVAAAAWFPVPVLVLAFGGLMIAYGLTHPKRFAVFALVVCLFGKSVAEVSGVGALDLTDESMIVALVVVCLGHRLVHVGKLRTFPGFRWFAAFVVLGLVSALALGVPLGVLASGTSLAAKGPLLALALAQLQWSTADLRRLARGGAAILVFVLVCSLINLAVPAFWQRTVGSGGIGYRSLIPSLIGPFTHPGELGPMAAFGFLAVVAWNTSMGSTRFTRVLAVGTAVVAVLSFRRKTWVGMAAGYLSLSARARRPGVLLSACLAVAAVAVVFRSALTQALSDLIETYFRQTNGVAARTVMTWDSFDVAWDHFPFGAGFGRFGSATAAVDYSPEYLARGYDHIWGLSAALGNDRYLTDTMWPAILGEAGYVGLVAFLLALLGVYRSLRQAAAGNVPIVRWLGLTGLAWLLQYLLESLGTPVFVSPPVYVPLFALVGLLASFGPEVVEPPVRNASPAAVEDSFPAEPAAPGRRGRVPARGGAAIR